ncbi:alpha/beta hydrolase [bacterium]|nr:alpha/beta hydrolase [bacterium]
MNIEFITDAYTVDGLKLPMIHFESKEKDICVICIHGMCGTIIDNYFATVWGKLLSKENIGFIYEHNRGHSIENDIVMKDGSFKRCGCMYEIFEDSIYDIDLAIETAKNKGYKRIILLGHSYGCNKVIYYYYKKHPNILGIILASAPDMVGSHILAQSNEYKELLKEARENINNNEPTKLLHKMIEDYMYMSSQTYYNWFNENSELDNLPVISNPEHWKQFEKIDVPILTFSGSKEEDYYLHLDLLKDKAINCKNFEYKIIDNTGHTYKTKETEIGNLIYNWISKNY